MSGGVFEYDHRRIGAIAENIECVLDCEEGQGNYTAATLDKFRKSVETLRRAGAMVERVGLLLSDDDGEQTFHARWDEALREIREMPDE